MVKRLSPWFQAVTLSTTLIIVSILIGYMTLRYCPQDEPQMIAPCLFQDQDIEVFVGMSIQDISDFNIVTDTFKMTGVIWFMYNPAKVDADFISHFIFELQEFVF
jgi:hypothetical protein